MADVPVPSAAAILLCDTIVIDSLTGKKTLVGLFTTFSAFRFPTLANVFLFARLTDAEGQYSFKVAVIRLEDDAAIAQLTTEELTAGDRLGFVELVLGINLLPVEKEGTYEFQLFANDVYVGRTVMHARPAEVKQ